MQMLSWARKQFASPHVGHLSNWVGATSGAVVILGAVGAVMTWAASGFSAIAQQGWGAVVFAGVGLTCFMAFAARAALPVVNRVWPPPPAAQPVNHQGGGIGTATLVEPAAPSENLRRLERDFLQIQNFTVDQATLHVLQLAMESIPINNGLSLETDDKKRHEKAFEVQIIIGRARSDFANTDRGAQIENILHFAKYKADQAVRQMQTPEHLNQIDFLRYEELEMQCIDFKMVLSGSDQRET